MTNNHRRCAWRTKFQRFVRRGRILLRSSFLWLCFGVNLPFIFLAGFAETFQDWLFLQADLAWLNIFCVGVPIFLLAAIWHVYLKHNRDFVWIGAIYLLPLINLVALYRIRDYWGMNRRKFMFFWSSFALFQLSAVVGIVSLYWGIATTVLLVGVLIFEFRAFHYPFANLLVLLRRFAPQELMDSPPILIGWNRWIVFRFRRYDIIFFVDTFGALFLGFLLAFFIEEAIIFLRSNIIY